MHESQKSNGLIWKWRIHTRLRHHLPVPNQYRGGGPREKGMRRSVLAVKRKGESILGFPLKFFWGEMSYWNGISPKKSKYELEPLDACHTGGWGRGLTLIQMRVVKTKRGKRQDKLFLSRNKAWCNQHSVMVVAGQLAGQWAILEGRPQRAKSGWGVKMINHVMANSIKGNSCEQWKGTTTTARNRNRKMKKKREKKRRTKKLEKKHEW